MVLSYLFPFQICYDSLDHSQLLTPMHAEPTSGSQSLVQYLLLALIQKLACFADTINDECTTVNL